MNDVTRYNVVDGYGYACHLVEAADGKFVNAAEYDALHARVAELQPMAECAAIMAVCGYFSRMRGPDAWLDHGGWDEYPELFACAGVDLRSFQHGTRFYAGSAPVPVVPQAAQADKGTCPACGTDIALTHAVNMLAAKAKGG